MRDGDRVGIPSVNPPSCPTRCPETANESTFDGVPVHEHLLFAVVSQGAASTDRGSGSILAGSEDRGASEIIPHGSPEADF